MSALVDYFAVCGIQVETLEKEQSTGMLYTLSTVDPQLSEHLRRGVVRIFERFGYSK